jgi:predicted dehydrogenase
MHWHVDQLQEVKAARVAALVDTSEASLKRMVDRHPHLEGLPTFSDYREMLDEVEVDGVVIATPHTLHFEQIMTCLDRGVHVLTEKPMVCSVADAKAVMSKAARKRRVLMISYQRHFFPAFRYARQLIAEGKIGKVTFIAALQAQEWLRGTKGTWRQEPRLSGGGQLNDSASHLIDSMLWVTDLTPQTVYAQIDNRGSKVDILSALTVKFKGGALGSMAVVGDAPGWWEDITFYGEEGAIYIRDNRLILQDYAATRKSGWPKSRTRDVTDKCKYKGNFDRNFVDSILGKSEPQTPPIWGLRVIQLTQAAWESAASGKPAKVRTR